MEKVLTVIIPTYNMEKYIRRCLDSLIMPNEQIQMLEVLIINDGSKDSSSMIAHEYQDKYPKTFRVIDKENGNYGSCINVGLKEAIGKYIKVLDADDWFDTEMFMMFIQQITDIDVDFILSDFSYYSEDEIKLNKECFVLPKNRILGFEDIINKYPTGFSMHAATYKKALIDKINYVQPEGISYTDQIWMQEPFAYVEKLVYLPYDIYKYTIGRIGQTMDKKEYYKNMNSHIKCSLSLMERTDKFNRGGGRKEFMTLKAINTLRGIYDAYLFECPDLPISELQDFDFLIKQNYNSWYQTLEKLTIHKYIPFFYIKKWHYNSNKRLSRLYEFAYVLSNYLIRVIDSCKKIKKKLSRSCQLFTKK